MHKQGKVTKKCNHARVYAGITARSHLWHAHSSTRMRWNKMSSKSSRKKLPFRNSHEKEQKPPTQRVMACTVVTCRQWVVDVCAVCLAHLLSVCGMSTWPMESMPRPPSSFGV